MITNTINAGYSLNKSINTIKKLVPDIEKFERQNAEPFNEHDLTKLYEYIYYTISSIYTDLKQHVEEGK